MHAIPMFTHPLTLGGLEHRLPLLDRPQDANGHLADRQPHLVRGRVPDVTRL